MQLEPLCIGIKRGLFRANDAQAKTADSLFESTRTQSLQRTSYRCSRCSYESSDDTKKRKKSVLHVHHLDNDHHNNEPENHAPHCSLDHAYHHIGCDAPTSGGSRGWASQMVIAYVPEVSSEDLNQLQRAVGAALSDPKEAGVAQEIVDLLGALSLPVRDVLGSAKAKDFAACFDAMSAVEYEQRSEVVAGFRVLFHPDILRSVGAEMLVDAPLFPVKSWEGVASGLGK